MVDFISPCLWNILQQWRPVKWLSCSSAITTPFSSKISLVSCYTFFYHLIPLFLLVTSFRKTLLEDFPPCQISTSPTSLQLGSPRFSGSLKLTVTTIHSWHSQHDRPRCLIDCACAHAPTPGTLFWSSSLGLQRSKRLYIWHWILWPQLDSWLFKHALQPHDHEPNLQSWPCYY